jgi:hypothetical protein
MKKFLLAALMVMSCGSAAYADALPEVMVGRWCYARDVDGERYWQSVYTDNEWKQCREADKHLTVRSNGYVSYSAACRFVSVSRTGQKTASSTKPRPQDMIPIVKIVARCDGEDGQFKTTFVLSYERGGFLRMQ